ncbi:MAG: succinyl-diaminopimelate desuccinylase [Planctomycetaceae bacterium]
MNDLAERLAAHTLALVDVASESHDEGAILAWLRARAPAGDAFVVADDQDACLVHLPARRRLEAPLVLLAGHVDTVPIAGNVPGRREAGAVVGRGASDMKAALAVMLELMDALVTGALSSDLDVGLLWFGREEVSTDESALLPLFARRPELAEASLAVMMEPTDNALEVGCLGNLNARVTVTGTAAHSARPWHGDNAIHGAIDALASIADLPIRDVELDGLTYREVVNVTTIEGGVAANVIPDRVVATVNFRYAPNRTPEEAEARIRELLGHRRAEVEIVSNAPPGPVTVRNPLVERLRAAGGLEVRPKQAWTPVAEFAQAGVDAVNCGPGDPRYAHTEDERVSVEALVRSFEVLAAFLGAGAAAEG